MEMSRCVTVVVMAFNVVLTGLIMRPLGRVATATAAFALALWPLSVAVERSVVLEPFLVFFCLLGTFLIFDAGDLASWRRMLLGGIAFGFAVEVKVWAVLPIAALVLVCLPRWRSRGAPLALGIAVGAIVPGLPFFLAAPCAFVHDVIVVQLGRNDPLGATTLRTRFLTLSGIGRLPLIGTWTWLELVLWSVFGLVVVWVYVTGRRNIVLLEWFVLIAPILVFVGMFDDPAFNEFYAYFPAAFLVLLAGVCASRIVSAAVKAGATTPGTRGRTFKAIPLVATALALVTACFLVEQAVVYAQGYLSFSFDPSAQLASEIPAGACVVTDDPTALLVANRFTPTRQGCPAEIDPFRAYLSEDNGLPSPCQSACLPGGV